MNISCFLPENAERFKGARALSCIARWADGVPEYRHISFQALNRMADLYACEFRRCGIVKGTKALVMLHPGFDFIAAVFAIFKTGAVPVLIDPGMGIPNMLSCISKTGPEAMVAVSKAHWMSLLFPGSFKSVGMRFTKGAMPLPKIRHLPEFSESAKTENFPVEDMGDDDMAAIVFTTGSTGPPKGVVYTHGIYSKQLEIIRDCYGAGPREIDMPGFPLFALFSVLLGMPCVIPDFNPSFPAKADPARLVRIIQDNKVSFSFASPALWRNVAAYCISKSIRFDSLKKVLMAGAPVPADLHRMLKDVIAPGGETIVPYGATEALPVANFAGSEMLAETAELTAQGAGYCVGYPCGGISVKIIRAVDEPIERWDEGLVLSVGEKGEIAVSGSVVTREYYNELVHNRSAKIPDPSGKIWHRMGDVGYFDAKGRLYTLGRKAHRVFTKDSVLYPLSCEAVFNRHPDVFRSALVGVGPKGAQTPAIVIEPKPGKMPSSDADRKRFTDELRKLGANNDATSRISHFLFHPDFPVDIRHNAKIFREKLAEWAGKSV